MAINNSRKISELRGYVKITEDASNASIPLAKDAWLATSQYNFKTDSYTNIRINIQAILDYAVASNEKYHLDDWLNVWSVGYEIDKYGKQQIITNSNAISYNISYSAITQNLFSYTASYTSAYTIEAIDYFGWQKFTKPSNIITNISGL